MPLPLDDETIFRRRLRLRLHRQLRRLTLWPLMFVFALTLALLGVAAYLLNSAKWVDRCNEVLVKISRIEKLAVDRESGVRAYRITGDAVFLKPLEHASAALPAELDALGSLLRDNPSQLTELQNLREALRAWNESATNVRERTDSKLPIDVPLHLRAKTLMDALRANIDAMQAHQQTLLGGRSLYLARVRMFIMPTILLAGALFAPLLVMSIRRTLAHLDTSYRAAWDESDRQRERLDVTLSSIGDAVIATDTTGAVAYLNPVAVALCGWSAYEARGKPIEKVFKIIHEQTRDTVESPVALVLREGNVVALTNHTLLIARDGRETPIADSAAPIRDPAGQITGVVMVFRDQTDEREADKRLRESEARKAAILNSSLDAIVSMDAGGLIVEFNPAAETMFGQCAVDVLGRPLADVIIPERLRAAHNRGLAHYLATREGPVLNKRIELPALRADGTEFSAELSIHRIDGTEPPRFSGFIRDITERTRAEKDLLDSQQRMRLAAEATGVGIWEWNILANTIRWDAQLFKIYGITPMENGMVSYSDWSGALVPEDLAENEAILQETIRQGGQSTRHFRIRRRADGECRIIEAVETTRANAQGETEWVVGTNLDITERKQAEEAVRAASERFRFLAESMPQKICTARPNGDIDYFNQQWLEFTGLTYEQLKVKGWKKFIHPDDLEENILRWQHCIETGESFEMRHRFLSKDGEYRWHLSRAHAMRDVDGKITMWIGSNTDIDDMMRAQEELMEAEEQLADRAVQLEALVGERTTKLNQVNTQLIVEADERKRLEAEIADAVEAERERLGQELHDGIVQEMVGVAMLLHALEQQMKKPAPEFANEARRLGLIMQKMQENARNLAKSFYPVELEQHGLFVALKGVALRTQERFGISCAVQADAKVPFRLDESGTIQLFRIAQEAVQNAAKHAQATEILIRLQKQDGALLLTVKDDGCGLSADAKPAGMGLRIMQYRARLIQGTLSISNGEGGGVLVSCSLPATDAP